MPSQEDYLDQLLKNLAGENAEDNSESMPSSEGVFDENFAKIPEETLEEIPEQILEKNSERGSENIPQELSKEMLGDMPDEMRQEDAVEVNSSGSFGVDDVSHMSEDEIERLLSAGGESWETESSDTYHDLDEGSEESGTGDVLDLLEGTEDENLQEIQELLQKSDNNEKILEDISESSFEDEEATGIPEELLADSDVPEMKKEKKSLREKMAERKAKSEEKKQAKKAKKEAAAQEKEAKKSKKDVKKKEKETQKADTSRRESDDLEEGENNLFDPSILDAIVSEAAGEGNENAATGTEAQAEADVFEEKEDDGTFEGVSENAEGPSELDGFDFDSLAANLNVADNATADVDGNADTDVMSGLDQDGAGEFSDVAAEDTQADVESPEQPYLDDDLMATLSKLDDEDGASEDGVASEEGIPDFASTDDVVSELSEEETEGKSKKKSLFARLLEFLTEEDEEEEKPKGTEDIQLSEENQEILNDLDSEKKDKKGKKEKKAKPKKEKKPAPAKKPKPKKEKKEKKPKEETGPLIPEKKMSLKKMLPVILIGVSLGIFLMVFVNSVVDYTDKKEARTAFYQGDYETVYQDLFGKELNESEQVMYAKSESILRIRLWIAEYEMFADQGEEMKALDSLIQTVDSYPDLYEYAVSWNAGAEVAEYYQQILTILFDKYGLTEEDAQSIADERTDKEYTRRILLIIEGADE